MEVIITDFIRAWTEDSYKEGEIGGFRQENLLRKLKETHFISYKEMKEYLVKEFDLDPSDKAWSVFEDGIVEVQQLESQDGYRVTDRDSEYKQWINGEINLDYVYYSIYHDVMERGIPTTKSIHQETGWQIL